MYEDIKLALIGGDSRQISVARRLASRNIKVFTWGIDSKNDDDENLLKSEDWQSAVKESSAVILPLPASFNGVSINCSSCENVNLDFNTLLEYISEKTLIIGGNFTKQMIDLAEDKNIRVIDYYDYEELKIKNAMLTAEGALNIAMKEIPISINDSNTLVVGYGRIGKALSSMLKSLGSNVTVAARNPSDIALAQTHGCKTLKIISNPEKSILTGVDGACSVIFNTVPYRIFDKNALSQISPDTLVIDLASAPGGIDPIAAKEKQIKVMWATSLPGKYAPVTAGNIIADVIFNILEAEGVLK